MELGNNSDQDVQAEISRIKKNFFEAELIYSREKDCLVKIINTFSSMITDQTEFTGEIKTIKQMTTAAKELPVDLIEKKLGDLRDKVFSEAAKEMPAGKDSDQQNGKEEQLLAAYDLARKILKTLTNDFYPVSNQLKKKIETLKSYFPEDQVEIELQKATPLFIAFISSLKRKIDEDFGYVNNTLLTLLDNVKEFENTLMHEFSGKTRQKEIDQFEADINDEVGSIVGSFNIHTTIDEIKTAVIGKLAKIKKIVSIRKKEDLQKSQKAKENIQKLKTKITAAEKDAREMSKKARKFQVAATKDKLTNVYNRSAFDHRLKAMVGTFRKGNEPFSIGLVDIDNFKWINDTYGHVSGDKVLIRVAQCLRESFRKNDFVTRYGGDEFAVILEDLSAELARERIMIFHNNFKKKRFRSAETGIVDVTVSIGIAQFKHGESVNSLINRADKEMYLSKKKKKE